MKKLLFLVFLLTSHYTQAKNTTFGAVMQPLDTTQFLESIEGHMSSIREKNLSKAYYNYTSALFKKHTSLATFQDLVKKFSPLYNNKQVELYSIYYVENKGYFTGRACSHENEAVGIEYEMVKENGTWRINHFNLRNIK